MTSVAIEIPNAKKLEARLNDPQFVGGPLRTLLTKASLQAETVAKGKAPVWTGQLRRDIRSEVKPLSARVTTGRKLEYYNTMEFGRKPGAKMPPPSSLHRWMRSKGIPTSAAFVLARSIARRGIKGRFFMKSGADAARNSMPKFLAEMGRAVGMNWSKPL